MTFTDFTPDRLLAILPEILLFALAAALLILDLVWKPSRRRILGWLAASGVTLILLATLAFSQPPSDEPLVLGGMVRWDWLAFFFNVLILFSATVTCLISVNVDGVGNRGDYYGLLLITTMGMVLMASSADLIMLFLAIETTSIPLYVLAGFLRSDDKSTESGLKYFLFGAVTSAVMLYGLSLIYGFTGETNLYFIADAIRAASLSLFLVGGIAVLVLVGFSFKIAAVPFHFWAPDVYEGAPTPITAYVSTASKVAGFAVLVRVMMMAFPSIDGFWAAVLAAMAVATMTLGNVLAIAQSNIKRLLAYSSIAHAGYALIGLVALSVFGVASMMFYLLAYVITNLAAFAVVILFARAAGSEEIVDYAGLSRRSPWLALALLIALLSLGGMPPLAGFVAKVYVFAAAVDSGLIWLAFIGVLNAIIGLYYYLIVLKVVYLYRSEDEDIPIQVPRPYVVALAACTVLILVVGIISGPWLDWSIGAASSLF
ncbi:MAG: NADH-quinone oxidoreductase subunit N [Anaerolineales bacterium]